MMGIIYQTASQIRGRPEPLTWKRGDMEPA